jgi:hypothetical protein
MMLGTVEEPHIFDLYDAGCDGGVWYGPNGTVFKNGPHSFEWYRHDVSVYDTKVEKLGTVDTWEVAVLRAEGRDPNVLDVSDDEVANLAIIIDVYPIPTA